MKTSFLRVFWPESSTRIQGVIRFRWIAIVGLIFGAIPLLQVGYLQKTQMPYLMAVIALLALFNGLTQGIWSKPSASQESRILFVQLLVDLLAATGLLFASGSANNPFIFVLCIHAFLGGMLLRGYRSLSFGFLVLLLLSILQAETFQDAKITVNVDTREVFFNFLAQWTIIIVSWGVAYLFASLLEKQEERIRNLQERQLKADRLKSLGALAAGFSHQMATPLNALKLRVDRAARKSVSQPEIQAELADAQESLSECIAIFHQMAGVFSNSTGGDLQKIKVKPLLLDILKAWKQDHPSVNVETHFQEGDVVCEVQALALSQTLFDLLDNAAEASDFKETVSLRLFTEGQSLILEVVDLGKGLSKEVISRLGEPFITDKKHGNGLGIYSAQMAAQAMGGEFSLFNNKSGKGATARLLISMVAPQEG
ncbi:sensor histidine kinase [Bdellovibrio svalbardensis]|uniref:histidine kinase n=1 Tax=Bdellovibrio svalbardensis TaxID=2972972 RepID=A0ABT6DEW9_9BACT|nr:HAMP domain-containing sensor histidine kinase [Bdellovibrio svalbardensis]MDG0815384.1 HAMP domain-containing histidine kinase [Bdellovibrio svalbardensis]